MLRPLAIAALLTTTIPSFAVAATPELRGTWITTTGLTTGTISTPLATANNFARLRAIGLNTVYQDVWRNGFTYFPSTAVQRFTGSAIAPEAGTRNVLAETLIQAHRNGMSEVAWLQYGFAAQFLDVSGSPTNSLATKMAANGWLLKDASGAYSNSSNKYAWMNPLVPQVRQLIIDMGVELVTKYDVDGVQFDDRLAWPTQFGYDDYTKAQYLAETGKAVPASYADAAFTRWRADKITAFAKDFSAAIRKANPNAIVAAAPGGYSDVYASYAVDAADWSRQSVTANGVTKPLFDELTPQIYNSSASNFNGVYDQDINSYDPTRKATYGTGLAINLSTGTNAFSIVTSQVAHVRASGTKGHIWWYSDGVLNADEANLTAFYNVAANGQADRPDRPANYRPAPTVASAAGSGRYAASVGETNRFSVIAKNGDTWTEILNTVLPIGTFSVAPGTGYSAVELLIDRRGFKIGDADFDGRVDLDDLFLVQKNFNATNATWSQGDFTLDGKVNADDLDVLGAAWGSGVPASEALPSFASLVPEPTTFALLVAAFPIARRRRW